MLKKLFVLLFITAVLLSGIVIVRTVLFVPKKLSPLEPVAYAIDEQTVVRHMSEAITIPTVSFGTNENTPREPFENFITWLADTYPILHR